MSHIFISYSSKHRDLTEQLADFLESCGLDVWWDKELAARSSFDWQIHEKLRTAGCVVVLWTPGALTSEWVKKEADYALERNMIVSVTADEVTYTSLPEPYCTHDQHRPFEEDVILRDVLAVREGRLLLEDKREKIPAPDARTPTMLLQAKFGLVQFTGNTDVKRDLVDWALAQGPYLEQARRASGRLIHGPGGLGKTRLLIEVAGDLRAKGWSAGFLARPGFDDQPEDTSENRAERRERQT
ncbi:MAG: toll/interleukin-1 receptor domain-containing protein, partial [bacterium]|nr:toll/interleukin-1 receptor domain-containing protein [bacterium]